MNQIKKNRKLIIAGISIILFLVLTYTIFNNKILYIDNYVESFILGIRNDKLTNAMKIITNISSAYALIAITILLFFILKNKKIVTLISYNLLLVFITNQTFKLFFHRERPLDIGLIAENGYSFPSGHAMISMAYFGFIAYLIYIKIDNKILKFLTAIGIFSIIFLIGFSRIYLGVHYFSDVIGGFLLAISYLMIFANISKKKIIEVKK